MKTYQSDSQNSCQMHLIVDSCNSFCYSCLQLVYVSWNMEHIGQSFHTSSQNEIAWCEIWAARTWDRGHPAQTVQSISLELRTRSISFSEFERWPFTLNWAQTPIRWDFTMAFLSDSIPYFLLNARRTTVHDSVFLQIWVRKRLNRLSERHLWESISIQVQSLYKK